MPAALWTSFASRFGFLLPRSLRADRPVVAVIRLTGVIGAVVPFRQGLSISTSAPALERAFGLKSAKAVALVVNSPGGSAVQSHLIFRRIRALAEEKKLPVFVFVEDAAASGGYMIACAGDEIFADPSSVVGSIGVVSASFGFDRLIDRFGIERRLHTTGPQKALLDPFRPEKPDDVERLKGIQAGVYEAFAALVKSRRGARLDSEGKNLFSGAVWTGSEALDLGLIDGLGDLRSVLRERFGDKVQLRPIPMARSGLVARWLGRREPTVGSTLLDPDALIAAIEARALWTRIGL